MIITSKEKVYFPSDHYVPVKLLHKGDMEEHELRGVQTDHTGHRYVAVVSFPKETPTDLAQASLTGG